MSVNREEILQSIGDDLVAGVRDEAGRRAILGLLRVVEIDAETIRELKEAVQRLRDEVNGLKGEQGKPTIRPQSKGNTDVSSERERKDTKGNRKKRKKKEVKVDRTEVRRIAKDQLPDDAVFKGYAEVTVQDLVLCTDNVLFRKEIYYSK